ncbi:MAG: prenyltransferase/squalene oxidase repeat-containing protein [Chloroflexota bacterium]
MFRRLILTCMFVSVFALPLLAHAQADPAVERAVDWLREQQLADGGFGMPGSEASDVGTTADAVIAFSSAGLDPAEIRQGDRSPLDFLAEQARTLGEDEWGRAAKIMLAYQAVGLEPRTELDVDLIALLLRAYDPTTGFQGQGPFEEALVVLALVNSGVELPDGALETLLASRLDDGSFSFNGDRTPGMGDSNTTAIVVQALVAAGARDEVGPSLAYFRSTQNEDGGWTYQKPSPYGEETDANSTALVIQALEAAGESLAAWGDPSQTLRSFQLPSGAFFFNNSFQDENLLATVQAIPALAGVDFTEIPSLAEESRAISGSPAVALGAVAILALVLVVGFVLVRRRG